MNYLPTTKRLADTEGPDFYPTPAWATRALLDHETFVGNVWECACGDGAMSRVLAERYTTLSTDLNAHGYGRSGVDFLTAGHVVDNVITNPPYNLAEAFVRAGVAASRRKLALLLRLAFLEGARRGNGLFAEMPPSRVWVFSKRITFYAAGAERRGSGTTAYAWYVWDKHAPPGTRLHWLRSSA